MDVPTCAADFAAMLAAALRRGLAESPLASEGADLEGWAEETAGRVATELARGRLELYRPTVLACTAAIERYGMEAKAGEQTRARLAEALDAEVRRVLEALGPQHALGSAAALLPDLVAGEVLADAPDQEQEEDDGDPATGDAEGQQPARRRRSKRR